MNISKLKVLLKAMCCLIISLWSDIQCIDNMPDIEENEPYKIINTPSENFSDNLETEAGNETVGQSSSQNEISDLNDALAFVSQPVHSQFVNQEDPTTSWVSYLNSPFKIASQMAHEVIRFSINN